MSQSIKVLLFHNIVSPHASPIFQYLAKKCGLTVLYCAQGERNRTWSEIPTGFQYEVLKNIEIRFSGKDLFTYFINPGVLKKIHKIKPDVIIVSGWDLLSYQLAALYSIFHKIPLLIWVGSTLHEPSWRRTLSIPFVKFLTSNANGLLAYGKRASDYLVSLGVPLRKITRVLNSTQTSLYKFPTKLDIQNSQRLKKNLGLHGKKVLLFYGQFIERKGVDILINAFTKLKTKYPELALLLIGNGSAQQSFQTMVKNISDIRFIDNPGDEEMPPYFYLSYIFVLPSREEVWGLVINQAMLCGVPVISSDVAGVSEDLVKDSETGYTFFSESVSDLSAKIETVLTLNKKQRGSLIKKASQIVQQATPERVANRIYQAIQKVL